MRTEQIQIAQVPALLIGEPGETVWLFVHGKHGCKEEALAFARRACPAGAQVLGIDLPEHGSRRAAPDRLLPWTAVPELEAVYGALCARWPRVCLRATSIGAWLAMQALPERPIAQTLLVSPVVDMERLIRTMMGWAGVTEAELERRREVPAGFGETLSWEYLCWARRHPLRWAKPAHILYAGRDNLTSRPAIEAFASRTASRLTMMEDGEHWFHTPEQVRVLERWEEACLEAGRSCKASGAEE